MISEYLEVFSDMMTKSEGKILLDNYMPSEGVYIVYTVDDSKITKKYEINIRFDRKSKQLLGSEEDSFEFIKELDYYSNFFEANKSMDKAKKIHSNNYLSFFVKNETYLKNELTDNIIDGYFEVMKNPYVKYSKKATRLLYEDFEEKNGKPDVDLINTIQSWVKENVFQEVQDKETKKYVKIFFILPDEEETLALYKKEGNRYFSVNLYNKNDFNRTIENVTYGVPNYNMGVPDKKPYVSHKTRKINESVLLELDKALLQKQFFDFIGGFVDKGERNIYINYKKKTIQGYENSALVPEIKNGCFLRVEKTKTGYTVVDFKTVQGLTDELEPEFILENHLRASFKEEIRDNEYLIYNERSKLEMLINRWCFKSRLINNYFTESKDIDTKLGEYKRFLLQYRDVLFQWLRLGQTENLGHFVKIGLKQFAMRLCFNAESYQAANIINLRISLLDYLNKNTKERDRMSKVIENLKNHILYTKDDWEFTDDEEYYFAVGQLANYYVNKSKAKKITANLYKSLITARTDEIVKREVKKLFTRYGYEEGVNTQSRVNILFGSILRYKPIGKVDDTMILAGLYTNNVIYMKKENGEEE